MIKQLVTASSNTRLDVLLELVCVKLQLSDTQFTTAEGRYNAIGNWLLAHGSAIRRYDPEVYPQGSLNIGTVIKPHGETEFDLDLVCEVQFGPGTHPAAVYDAIWDRMAEHGTYKNMITRRPRCIRVDYANEFHLDIVPAIPDPSQSGGHILVPELHADLSIATASNGRWKPSNPRDYKPWFKTKCDPPRVLYERNAMASAEPLPQPEPIHAKPSLKRSVQLLKRWRDVEFEDRKNLEPPSILLTTHAAHYHAHAPLCTDAMNDIVDQLVAMRQRDEITCRTNPVNSKEVICERWQDPKALKAFDIAIVDLQTSWKRLLTLRGIPEIAKELKRLFGENPVNKAIYDYADKYVNNPRERGDLLLDSQSRRVISKPSIVSAAPVMAIKPTTFFGDEI